MLAVLGWGKFREPQGVGWGCFREIHLAKEERKVGGWQGALPLPGLLSGLGALPLAPGLPVLLHSSPHPRHPPS